MYGFGRSRFLGILLNCGGRMGVWVLKQTLASKIPLLHRTAIITILGVSIWAFTQVRYRFQCGDVVI